MDRKLWRILLVCTVLIGVVSLGAWAEEEDIDEETRQIREAVEEAAGAVREALQAVPDPVQAATQASQDELSQGTPTREEMFVYSLSPWLGMEFGGTFAPKQADAIYLMAGAPS